MKHPPLLRRAAHVRTALACALLCGAPLGCGSGAGSSSPTHAAHAEVTRAAAPGGAALVTLSEEAHARLGISVAPVEPRDVPETRTVAGECAVPPGRIVTLAAPFAAHVRALPEGFPAPGASVSRAAGLLVLAPLAAPEREVLSSAERITARRTELDLALARATASGDLEAARARLDAAAKALARAEALAQQDAGSQRAVDEARAEEAYAAAALRRAEASVAVLEAPSDPVLDAARDVPPGAVLAAPFAGIVTALLVAPGQAVAAGAPLVELSQQDPLAVRALVDVADLARVDPTRGAQVGPLAARATDATWPARQLPAPPRADPATATGEVWFELPNSEGIWRPGQRVGVTLELSGAREAAVVPASALVRDAHGGAFVYAEAGERTYSRHRVEVARVVGDLAVLARGPEPGTPVVVAGAVELYGTEFESGK